MTREEAIEWINYHIDISDYDEDDDLLTALKMAVKALEKQRAGNWFDVGSLSCRCSECGGKSNRESQYCPNCGAVGQKFEINRKYSSDEKAIEAWNRRASEWKLP